MTRKVLLNLEDYADLYVPVVVLEEIARKSEYLALRKGISPSMQRYLLSLILSNVKIIKYSVIKPFLERALNYVRDPDDAYFVALALYLKKSYNIVVILTWNSRDYMGEKLEVLSIKVLTPIDVLDILGVRK